VKYTGAPTRPSAVTAPARADLSTKLADFCATDRRFAHFFA
jgi:hypothetical protein